MDPLYILASHYRAAQLAAHTYHHLARGPSFFSDHKEFGSAYAAYEEAFDQLCEHAISLKLEYSPDDILDLAVKIAKPTFKDSTNLACFNRLLKFEGEFQRQIKEIMAGKNVPDSTQNLIQGLATESGSRVYFFSQRTS